MLPPNCNIFSVYHSSMLKCNPGKTNDQFLLTSRSFLSSVISRRVREAKQATKLSRSGHSLRSANRAAVTE